MAKTHRTTKAAASTKITTRKSLRRTRAVKCVGCDLPQIPCPLQGRFNILQMWPGNLATVSSTLCTNDRPSVLGLTRRSHAGRMRCVSYKSQPTCKDHRRSQVAEIRRSVAEESFFVAAGSLRAFRLPLQYNGLALPEAFADRHSAYWAS